MRFKRKAYFSLIISIAWHLFVWPAVAVTPDGNSTAPGTTKVLLISDFHLKLNQHGDGFNLDDSSLRLVDLTISAAHRSCPDPAFIVCPGDFLAHGGDSRDAIPTLKTINKLFDKYFHGKKVIPALGNNDSPSGDYCNPATNFLRDFVSIWSNTVPGSSINPGFAFSNFAQHDGLFIADLPCLSNATAVVFNSTRICLHPPQHTEMTCDTNLMADLGKVVEQAATQHQIWLVFHIPPGLDLFAKRTDQNMWCQSATDSFVEMVAKNKRTIKAMIAAHTHKSEFRVIYKRQEPVSFISLVPGVAVGHKNNPAFQIATVECATGKIRDLQTYCLTNFSDLSDLGAGFMDETRFSTAFRQAYLHGDGYYDADCLDWLQEDLGKTNSSNREPYLRLYSTGYRPGSVYVADRISSYVNTLRIPPKQR